MGKNNLILLCDNYPLSAGEFFIDDEMRVIATEFDKVLVYTASADTGKNLNRFVPYNAEVISFSRQKLEAGKLKSIFRILKPMFLSELFFALKKLSLKYWVSVFKIMYVDMHRATNLKKELVGLCRAKNIDMTDCIFYSYWHDYKALALAMLRQKCGSVCVARAHGWDNFPDRYIIKYLPFKPFIVKNLSKTLTVSQAGKDCLEKYINDNVNTKIIVSRLGKFNGRPLNNKKNNQQFLICSCSNLIELKRVDKIIEVLSLLDIEHIRWVHFGDGPLRTELETMAKNKLPNVEYEFRSIVPNYEILDFYAENYVDLFINLSSSEGIPVSIMEALSASIPVLATNVGGTSEAVNSKNGFLIPADFDCNSVAQIIDNYLDMNKIEQQAIRRNAYEFWKENYEARKNYETFYGIITK